MYAGAPYVCNVCGNQKRATDSSGSGVVSHHVGVETEPMSSARATRVLFKISPS